MNIIKTIDSCIECCIDLVDHDIERDKIIFALGRMSVVLEQIKLELEKKVE